MTPLDNPVWTTSDEILYLRGLARRDGRRVGSPRGVTVISAKTILESWLATCRRRQWDISVDVEECRRVAHQMIEDIK